MPCQFILIFPGGSDDKESTFHAGDLGSILGLGRSPREEKGYPLQNSCLENSLNIGALAGYSPWGSKELDKIELLTLSTLQFIE